MLKNPNTHLTAKNREKPSFPTKWLFRNKKIKGRVLDFGAGYGQDGEFLRGRGMEVVDYDPHYFPNWPEDQFDTIICNYVLNVLLPEEQASVLMQVSEKLKPGGRAFFTVRRDLKTEGYRIHKEYKKPTYQANVKLPYQSVLLNDFTEIYQYQHFNYRANGKGEQECPFCYPERDRTILTETATAFAIYDKHPVSPGHTLIIPKKHIADYFDLSFKEQSACWLIVNRMKYHLEQWYESSNFNIGVNIGNAAGQTVPHVHIHLIPRFEGDVEDPTGGVRNVIPGKGKY